MTEQIHLCAIENRKRIETYDVIERHVVENWITETRTVGRGKDKREETTFTPFRFTVTRMRYA